MKIIKLVGQPAEVSQWRDTVIHKCGAVLAVDEDDLTASSVVDGVTYRGPVVWFRCPHCGEARILLGRGQEMPGFVWERVVAKAKAGAS